MTKDTRPNTYSRIVEASLMLFNEEGERNISTNHIAAHLGISPGNLYYHFRNKDEIIVQLFKRYSEDLLHYLRRVVLPKNVCDAIRYMAGIYDVMWRYRFLFSDVNALLARSAELLGEHNNFTHAKVSPLLVELLTQLNKEGIIRADATAMNDLALNIWMITKYWFDFDLLTRRAMAMASAAAVASSSNEAPAISWPLKSMHICWKFSSASSRPCAISA